MVCMFLLVEFDSLDRNNMATIAKNRLIEAQTKVKHLGFIKAALKVLSASLWLKIISADV